MVTSPKGAITELNERSRAVFREIVDEFVRSGEPIGSRTLSRRLATPISPATIRNVMSDLEEMGLLYAPHPSAGRLPTDAGLRLFVDGLLEIGELTETERQSIESQCAAAGMTLNDALSEATSAISGLAGCAGMVFAPKSDRPLKHIEFVNIGDNQALVVLVSDDGIVENRIIAMPVGTPPSALIEAGNYLNARLVGRTLDEAQGIIEDEITSRRAQLSGLTAQVVEAGLATWVGGDNSEGSLIIKGQANLLNDIAAMTDLERIKNLFEALETRETMACLLELTGSADGVQIYIGADNTMFNLAGCSMVVAPFKTSRAKVVGAIGVIGPTRINYARIIPIVDYTAKVISRLIG
jgi:heat-inducible transcriptional repressor